MQKGAALFTQTAAEKGAGSESNAGAKVPPKLQQTLELAFEKAFALVFEKGTGMIEKTYPKDRLEKEYLINRYADEIHANRRSLSVFSKKAQATGRQNTALSGLSGIGMGALGIGIPDIPVFTAIALKCIYEIAVRYGKGHQARALVNGWYAGTELWQPNRLADILDSSGQAMATWLIVNVSWHMDDRGCLTELSLSPKEAYELLPEMPKGAKGKKGKEASLWLQ